MSSYEIRKDWVDDMMSRRRFLAAIGAGGAALIWAGCARNTSDRPPSLAEVNPFSHRSLFVDPDSPSAQDARALKSTNPEAARRMQLLAAQPQVDWYGDWFTDITAAVDQRLTEIVAAKALPTMVLYNLPNRDCGGFAAGGAKSPSDYMRWINGVKQGIRDREVVCVLEPDALGQLEDCGTSVDQRVQLELLATTVQELTAAKKIHVYIDASQWVPPDVMADRLKAVGVGRTNGVAVNTSAFLVLPRNIGYVRALQRYLPEIHAVIDTSRNGRAIPDSQICNPPGAAIGHFPTTDTGQPDIDAYLWIKRPGDSDGPCNGGPVAGDWWPQGALQLVENAE